MAITSIRFARLVTAAVMAAALVACGGKSEADLADSGKQLLAKNDLPGAIIQFKSALQKQETGEVRLLLGQALLDSGDPVSAIVELRKAQELGVADEQVVPPLARALLSTGEENKMLSQYGNLQLKEPQAVADLATSVATAHLMRGEKDQAATALGVAQRAVPGFVAAVVLEARIKAAGGELDDALGLLDQALVKAPGDERAGILRGEVLWHGKKDLAAALASFKQVLEARPKAATAHTSIIALLSEQKKPDEAKAQFEQLKKVLPNHPDTLFLQAQFAFADKDYKGTRDITDRLLKAMPEHPRVLELAGAAHYRMKSYTEAEALLARAIKSAPGLLGPRHMLAQTYLRTNQPAKAIELLQPVVDGKQPDGTSLALTGEAWLQLGDSNKSDAAFALAAKVAPSDTRVRTSVALAQLNRGNNSVAVAQLESIAAEDTGPRADIALISARLRQNDLAGALKAIDGLERKTPDRPLADNLRGRVMLLKRDLPAATKAFEAALKKDPTYFPAVASMAALDLNAGKADVARKRFDDLLQAQPNSYQALVALAELNVRVGGLPEETVNLLRRAVKANAGEPMPHLALVNLLLASDAKAALTAARDAAAALPKSLDVQDALGRAQLAANSAEQATVTFRQLVALQPRNPLHQLRLAEALLAGKDVAGAQAALKKALEIKPDLAAAQRAMVLLSLQDKRPQDAMKFARDIQQHSPKDPLGFLLEGDIEVSRKNWDAAIASYRTAHSLAKSTDSVVRLHMAMRAANRGADGDLLAAAWTKEHPKDGAFRFYLGDAALAKKDYPGAEAHYRAVMDLQPRNALALNNVAWLMVQQGKPGALAIAKQANEVQPGRPALMDTLALALAAENKLPEAIDLQKQAISRSPNEPSLKLTLAKLLIKSGDKPYARAELEELAKLGDKFREQAEVASLLKSL